MSKSVGLNANSRGFFLGLNQNLQLTIQFFFELLPMVLGRSLQNFSSQQMISTLLLSVGFTENLNNGGVGNVRTDALANDVPIIEEVFSQLATKSS